MVDEIVGEDVYTFMSKSELHNVITQNVNGMEYKILKTAIKTACEDSLLGFLGDHFKAQIDVKLESGETYNIHLFIKSLPRNNISKANFISETNFFKKESTLYNGPLKKLGGGKEPDLWRPVVYLATDNIIVMRDHSYDNFVQLDKTKYLDYNHCAITLESVAKFHSLIINYESKCKNTTNYTYRVIDEYKEIGLPTTFFDCPWLRAGVKSTLKFLGILSRKYNYEYKYFNKIEENILHQFLQGCDSARIDENQINVVIHRDLWTNNILFRHDMDGKPINAMLIDFQCIQYGPAALDIMGFLHLNTEREFRNLHETSLLKYYYDKLTSNIQDENLNCRWDTFLQHVEICRKFGLILAILIFPYILMDSFTAKSVFDDPLKWDYYNLVDRSEPCTSYAEKNKIYKNRILESIEEFVERYIL